MATKTYVLNFVLILSSFQLFAQTDEQLLADWTKKNEQILLKNNEVIESSWFQEKCLALAKQMEFTHVKQCHLLDSKTINAYVFNNGHVYFTSAMMRLINNKHQWASILAHENGHLVLKHYLKTLQKVKKPGFFFPKHKVNKRLKQNELEADEWAKNKLLEFKMDDSQIYYFLQRVESIKGPSKTKAHLKNTKRIKRPHEKEVMDKLLIKHLELVLAFSSKKRPKLRVKTLADNPSLRASAIKDNVLWVAGTKGKVFKSADNGESWQDVSIKDSFADIRDIQAFDKKTAIIMTVGEGSQSKLLKTHDGGFSWELLFANPHPKGFFDSIDFWDNKNGLLLGDPVEGYYYVARTSDGGHTWVRVNKDKLPKKLEKEAAFAASGHTLIVAAGGQAWFTTGGFSASVIQSQDYGQSWLRNSIPLDKSTQTAGGYGIGLNQDNQVFVVGGDYLERDGDYNNTVRFDSSWQSVNTGNNGLRTAFACNDKICLSTGKLGTDVSFDQGQTWQTFSLHGFYTLASNQNIILCAGHNGRVAVTEFGND